MVKCTFTVAARMFTVFRARRAEINCGAAIRMAKSPAIDPAIAKGAPNKVINNGRIVETSLKAIPNPKKNSWRMLKRRFLRWLF